VGGGGGWGGGGGGGVGGVGVLGVIFLFLCARWSPVPRAEYASTPFPKTRRFKSVKKKLKKEKKTQIHEKARSIMSRKWKLPEERKVSAPDLRSRNQRTRDPTRLPETMPK